SSPPAKNISLYQKPDSPAWSPPSRAHKRGASRSSRTLGAGCNGRAGSPDERSRADGKIAWSWPPDAEVKPAGEDPPATVANKPGAPGRARIRRNTIAQGRPDRTGRACGF